MSELNVEKTGRELVNQFIINQLKQENGYLPFPPELSDWKDQTDIISSLTFLAGQFVGFLDNIIQINPEMVDQMNIPIELTPAYLGLNLQIEQSANLLIKLEILSENFRFILNRTGMNLKDLSPKSKFIIFEWSLLNRFLDPLPLGKIGATSVAEIYQATPKKLKQIIKWHHEMEDRMVSYPLTTGVGVKVTATPTEMIRLIGMEKIIPNISNLRPREIDIIQVLKFLTNKRGLKSFVILEFLNFIIQEGKFIKLLPDCQEQTTQLIQL